MPLVNNAVRSGIAAAHNLQEKKNLFAAAYGQWEPICLAGIWLVQE